MLNIVQLVYKIIMQEVKRKPLKLMLQNQTLFWQQIEQCIKSVTSQQIIHHQTIQKLQAQKYPWNNIQQVQIIKELRDMLLTYTDHSVQQIVSNEIIKISDQLLNLRNQLTDFTLSQSKKNKEFHDNASLQIQELKKKVATNNAINNQKELLGPRYSRSHANVQPKSVLTELSILKSQLQKVRDSSNIIDNSILEGKIQMLESELTQLKLQTKMRMEEIKQKNLKIQNEINNRMKENSSKELIAAEVKAVMKARSKVFNVQVTQIKQQLIKIKQKQQNGQIQIQNYISNQLKSIWVHNINLKRRIQKIESEIDVVNASFVVD